MKKLIVILVLFIVSCQSKDQRVLAQPTEINQNMFVGEIIYNDSTHIFSIVDTLGNSVVSIHTGKIHFDNDTAAIKTLLMLLAQDNKTINDLEDSLCLYKWYKGSHPQYMNYKL